MAPSVFIVLFWRLSVQLLYPYGYMDCSLQEALGNENLIWSKGDRIEVQLLMLMRDSFRTTIVLVMMMEMLAWLDAALNLPMALAARL
ncbi:uncharacterized protein LOC108053507 [Drosophila rhopaloa]|uniref:Uncharacterized protein LOC108052997 n=1 Tax=Drosophila rhopaloa TaxID=1041015 RepID=A0A6P4G0S8_DRORH|nr:uncharacterized protein LOC108053507 [Drosophila rhopaloa]